MRYKNRSSAKARQNDCAPGALGRKEIIRAYRGHLLRKSQPMSGGAVA